MFTNFTWWQFFGTFLLFCIVYYPIILWLYFKKEAQLLFRLTSIEHPPVKDPIPENSVETAVSNMPDMDALSNEAKTVSLSDLLADITNGVKAAKDAGASKDQLMGLLQNMLLKYPELKHSTHRVQINDFIVQECTKANYVVQLFEVYALWATQAESND